jgi:hypothetical protein
MDKDFSNKHFTVIKNAISKEITNFCFDYVLLKRKVAEFLHKNSIEMNTQLLGLLGGWNDNMVKNTYACYADTAMETLLTKLKPTIEKITGMNLCETYSYLRIYKKGDILERHIDREACEVSTTLNLGGDDWSIFVKTLDGKENEIILYPGDMLVYKGSILEHWRKPFEKEKCAQVFLHYNNIGTSGLTNQYDGRPFLGLPMTEYL